MNIYITFSPNPKITVVSHFLVHAGCQTTDVTMGRVGVRVRNTKNHLGKNPYYSQLKITVTRFHVMCAKGSKTHLSGQSGYSMVYEKF